MPRAPDFRRVIRRARQIPGVLAMWAGLQLAAPLGIPGRAPVARAPVAGELHAQTMPTPSTRGVRLDEGRFTVVAERRDERLARSLLQAALARDTFPGLPRPTARVLIAVAPDADTFRAWVGPFAPEWGAAIAFPDQQRLVMQGSFAGSDAGDPLVVLRHELAHLALHEHMGNLPTRWFDEGYASVAAGEFTREQAFETSLGMVWRTLPSLEALEQGFRGGGMEASWSYAMAHRIVSELTTLGGEPAFARFIGEWNSTRSFEKAVRSAYGMTGDAFEQHWKTHTRQRYGALALVTNVSAAVGLFSLVLVPLFVLRKRRDRRKLEAMRAADAAQEAAARASALQALLDMSEGDPDRDPEDNLGRAGDGHPADFPEAEDEPLPTAPTSRYPQG